jgi:hypothetical protein
VRDRPSRSLSRSILDRMDRLGLLLGGTQIPGIRPAATSSEMIDSSRNEIMASGRD